MTVGLSRWEKRYFREVMFEDETIAYLDKPGLLYLFEPEEEERLTKGLPYDAEEEVWFFNESRDRECVERHTDGKLSVNPSHSASIYGMPVIW